MNKKQELQYILGCLFGDAYITKSKIWKVKKNCYIDWYAIDLNAVDLDFVTFFRDCVRQFGRGKLNILFDKSKVKNWNDQYKVGCSDQIFVKKMKKLKDNFNYKTDINFSFLKGLIDSEGCMRVSLKNYDSDITFFSTNKKLIYGCKEFMVQNKFKKVRIQADKREGRKICYNILISTYPNLKLFNEKIGFTIKRKQIKLDKVLEDYKIKLKKAQKYYKALTMRKNGKTIPFICQKLDVPEGTMLGWIYNHRKPHILNHL